MGRNDPLFDTEAARCRNCGFEVEGAVALIHQAEDTIEGLNRDLIGKRSRIKELEREGAEDLKRHPRYKEACEVARYWVKMLAPKAREPYSEARIRPICARLMNGHTVEGLKLCIDGYAKKPYIVNRKRASEGNENQRFVKCELIFRDADRVEAGIRMAREAKDRKVYADWRDVRRSNHATILKALPGAVYDPMMHAHNIECPRPSCEGTLTIFEPQGVPDTLLSCSDCAMNERTFLAALVVGGEAPDPRVLNVLEGAQSRLEALPV